MPGDPVGEVESGGVAAGENGGPAGRTYRARCVAVGEEHAVLGQLVDVRSLVEGCSVAPEVAPAEVVDEKEDEIGFIFCKKGRVKSEQKNEAKEFHGRG